MALALSCSAFVDGAPIPAEYTCDGADRSPPLAWSGVPPEARSLALICDDPDAPGRTFVHWVLYGMPPQLTSLGPGIPPDETLADLGGALQGTADHRRTGYGGPCPPPGKPHRYHFTLYALDAPLDLGPRARKDEVERAMHGHVLERAQLVGLYGRNRH